MTLTTGLLIALIVPLFFAIMSVRTGNFYYNLGMTGSCIVLLVASPQPMALLPVVLCLLISILGDYFMGHQQSSNQFYLFGIIAFFCAHACLIWYSYTKLSFSPWLFALGAVLAIGYGAYLALRILPHVRDIKMQIAIIAYASVSVIALTMAVGMNVPLLQRALFALGVASIVVSDTLICESDFAGNPKPAPAIMPTYFLCHILITASCLVAAL